MSRINPSTSAKLNGGRMVALRVLPEQLGLDPKIVYGWARRGVRGRRLPTINLAGWRYTTIQACNQFVADVNNWSQPPELGPRLGMCLGSLVFVEEEGIT